MARIKPFTFPTTSGYFTCQSIVVDLDIKIVKSNLFVGNNGAGYFIVEFLINVYLIDLPKELLLLHGQDMENVQVRRVAPGKSNILLFRTQVVKDLYCLEESSQKIRPLY